jgi:ABC-2 type transport system ATP-binding protein
MLHFQSYRKSFNGRTLLSIDDMSLEHGIYWLQAPNGAGKSTLLRSIAGIIPFEGNIIANGKDGRRDRIAFARIVSWVGAEPQYPPFLSGRDLVAFYLKTRGGTDTEARQLLERFDATSYHDRAVGTWSSGMLKKLSLLLAFLGAPEWILLDEPLITLDAAAQQTCLELIAEHQARGASFLITSHQALSTLPATPLFLRDQSLHR